MSQLTRVCKEFHACWLGLDFPLHWGKKDDIPSVTFVRKHSLSLQVEAWQSGGERLL